jgi:hypothetical protein
VNGSFISEGSAVISGAPAWLLDRIMRSPDVATVLSNPPRWIDRDHLAATLDALHLAAKAFDVDSTALERGKPTTLGATVAQSAGNWTTAQAATYLRISVRRAQELAATDLGGTRIGRRWAIPAVAVRQLAEQRATP